MFFEGAGFFLRPKGAQGGSGIVRYSASHWHDSDGLHMAGAALAPTVSVRRGPAVRYDLPTWGGFRFETSYEHWCQSDQIVNDYPAVLLLPITWIPISGTSPCSMSADWNSIKISLAGAYTMRWNPTRVNGGCPDRLSGRLAVVITAQASVLSVIISHRAWEIVRPLADRVASTGRPSRLYSGQSRTGISIPTPACLVREAVLAEDVEPARRHGALWRVWPI